LGSARQAYELLDGMGVAVRNNKSICSGWLDGIAATGFSNHLGWYDGFHILMTPPIVVSPLCRLLREIRRTWAVEHVCYSAL
jgi:hypothetical protein